MQQLTPITTKERIQAIDVIRGFAILGIFTVNMQGFNSPGLYLDLGDLWKAPIDLSTQIFIDIFAQASFYTLFSFLLGFGMVVFKERVLQRNHSFVKLYTRRLLVLLVIGLIHAFLIWHGDILISYAVVGFSLMLFHNAEAKTLLRWALSLMIIPSLLITWLTYSFESNNPQAVYSRYNEKLVNKSLEVYSSGSFSEITEQRINDWLFVNGGEGIFFLIIILLPMFLLGAYFSKRKIFHEVETNLSLIKRIWLFSMVIGTTFKLLPYLSEQSNSILYIQDTIGGPAAAIFYATSLVLLLRYKFWSGFLSHFAYVGRLSLSNYLFQSIISTLIFYSYGLGLYGQVSPFAGLIMTFVIFILQIILSKLWLKRFNIGPIEWAWKSLTYNNKQPLKAN